MEAPVSDAFVFFGITGDLAFKMVIPALQAMVRRRGGASEPIIGVASARWTLDSVRARMRDSLTAHGGVDEAAFTALAKRLRYVGGDYRDPALYDRLREQLGDARHPLYYLAIPPSLFATVVEGLQRSGCARGARVVLEKPFGRDLASARELNTILHRVFPESAIFRIDHFLGKEAVQNLMYFRFANSFLEPIWNRNYVHSVQITLAEDFGVQGRGRFYEEAGAIRDVVQNHLLQVTGLLAMEPPISGDAEARRAETARVFQAMRPLAPANVVRGQFRSYRQVDGVAPDSTVETFAALRLEIDDWRWAGVPFYVRAGKCLPVTTTEVLVRLHRPPQALFGETAAPTNHLRFRLSPQVQIALGARTKRPGEAMVGEDVELLVCDQHADEMDAYERLLRDAAHGDATLFGRQDAVEAAWQVVDPVLGNATPVHEYEPNAWGPAEADALIAADGGWHNPMPLADGECAPAAPSQMQRSEHP